MLRCLILLLTAGILASCRSSPQPAAGPTGVMPGGLSLRGQLQGRLELTDGSRWQVQPAGQSASLRWRPGDPVRVVRSGHPAWPFLLTHLPTGAAALSRPAPLY